MRFRSTFSSRIWHLGPGRMMRSSEASIALRTSSLYTAPRPRRFSRRQLGREYPLHCPRRTQGQGGLASLSCATSVSTVAPRSPTDLRISSRGQRERSTALRIALDRAASNLASDNTPASFGAYTDGFDGGIEHLFGEWQFAYLARGPGSSRRPETASVQQLDTLFTQPSFDGGVRLLAGQADHVLLGFDRAEFLRPATPPKSCGYVRRSPAAAVSAAARANLLADRRRGEPTRCASFWLARYSIFSSSVMSAGRSSFRALLFFHATEHVAAGFLAGLIQGAFEDT